MTKSFYDQAQLLDLYKSERNPSPDQINILLALVGEEKFARYFFEGLENPVWVTPLYQAGFFSRVPNPIEVKPGSFQLPGWPAGEYLARFADHYEEIVIDVIKSTKSENWRVQEILVDALMKISPTAAVGLVPAIDVWLAERFSDMLPNKLIPLADHLREAGIVNASIQILESVITPVLPPNVSEFPTYHSLVRFRSDHYWVNDYCENQIPKLITINPAGVVSVFEHQLVKTIELCKQLNPEKAELQVGYYWRMDIPNRLSEESVKDGLDILIDGLRDGLVELCNKSVDEGKSFLEAYLSSDHLIFRRIALFTLRTYGQKYPELVNRALLHRSYLKNSEYVNEYRGLLRDQFANASEEVREKVIEWILEGPTNVDSRAIHRAKPEKREVIDDGRREVREEWVLYNLEIIREYLYGEPLERLNELAAIHGKPDVEEKPRVIITSWSTVSSPVSVDELAKKSFVELKQLFLDYVPDDSFFNSRESLAQTFQGLVREDLAHYIDFASALTDPEIRYVYIYHYLSGVRESVKNKNGKLEDAIIGLCERVIDQREDQFKDSTLPHEPDLLAVQMEVARLIETALQSNDSSLTRGQLDRIRSLLIALAHHPDPEKDDEANSSFDPFTKSLNCVRGEAMHGIMHYSLYLIRQQEKIKNVKLNAGFLEPEIQEVLEEKLNFTVEPSLAVHSVYGAFVPQLHFLSRDWLESHLTSIFPKDEEKNAYWKAAWDAYIFASNVYRDVFRLLTPEYQRFLRLLSQTQDEQKHLGGSPNERLAQHIMFAYLSELTDFGHENLLLDLFFENAPDSVRASGIFWIGRVLGNEKPSSEDILWKRCWSLWQSRLIIAESQDISQNTQEISDFMRWLENSPIGLEHLYPALRRTVKYLHDDFDARQLTSYAAEHCERFPLEAVTLLQMTILEAKESWWTPKGDDEEKILRAAMNSGNKEAKRIAVEVINYRGERGDFRWKNLLE